MRRVWRVVRKVVYRPLAREDLDEIYDRRAEDDPETALALVSDLERRCETLGDLSNRGTPRDEIAPGMRSIPYKKRAVIAYLVEQDKVVIVGIMYGGRDLAALTHPGRLP